MDAGDVCNGVLWAGRGKGVCEDVDRSGLARR